MSNAKRPSLSRKVTPASEKKRKDALNEGLRLAVDGQTYTVRAGDLTALDAQALRREVGMSFIGLMDAFHKDPDLDLIAAVMWLSRRVNGEHGLEYADVAGELGYDADFDVERAGEPTQEETDSPEG